MAKPIETLTSEEQAVVRESIGALPLDTYYFPVSDGQIVAEFLSNGSPVTAQLFGNDGDITPFNGNMWVMTEAGNPQQLDIVEATTTDGHSSPYRVVLGIDTAAVDLTCELTGGITHLKGTFSNVSALTIEQISLERLAFQGVNLYMYDAYRLKSMEYGTSNGNLVVHNAPVLDTITVGIVSGIEIINCPLLTAQISHANIQPYASIYYQTTGLLGYVASGDISDLGIFDCPNFQILDLSAVTHLTGYLAMDALGDDFDADAMINSITNDAGFAGCIITSSYGYTSASAAKRTALELLGVIFAEI